MLVKAVLGEVPSGPVGQPQYLTALRASDPDFWFSIFPWHFYGALKGSILVEACAQRSTRGLCMGSDWVTERVRHWHWFCPNLDWHHVSALGAILPEAPHRLGELRQFVQTLRVFVSSFM